jgi:hypothetical protein
VIVVGLILLLIGLFTAFKILVTFGVIVLVVGLILMLVGATGRSVVGRRYWY